MFPAFFTETIPGRFAQSMLRVKRAAGSLYEPDWQFFHGGDPA